MDSLIKALSTDKRFELSGIPESKYFEDQLEQQSFWRRRLLHCFVPYVRCNVCCSKHHVCRGGKPWSGDWNFASIGIFTTQHTQFVFAGIRRLVSYGWNRWLSGNTPVQNGLSTGTANFASFSEITFSFHFGPRVRCRE